ncbi:MAG: methionine synthase [Enterococcus sp.]
MELNKKEILRYLGYKRHQELTPEIDALVDQMSQEVQAVTKPRYTYQIFNCHPDPEREVIVVEGTELVLPGKAIYKHLQHAQKVALLGVTLGLEVERVIRQYEISDLTKAMILDSCCVEYIEKIADLAECDIEQAPEATGLTLNRRFSPGYGDLPLAIQPQFLQTINATNKLGIHLTQTLLMIPRKSVTAITGLFADEKEARPRRQRSDCLDCDLKDCNFRIGGPAR